MMTGTGAARKRQRETKQLQESDADWWARIARLFPHINIVAEYDRAAGWAADHRRPCSRPYLLNWFKRAELAAVPQGPPPAPVLRLVTRHEPGQSVRGLLQQQAEAARQRAARGR